MKKTSRQHGHTQRLILTIGLYLGEFSPCQFEPAIPNRKASRNCNHMVQRGLLARVSKGRAGRAPRRAVYRVTEDGLRWLAH